VKYGKDHTSEAVVILGLIATLMVSASLFEASAAAFQSQAGEITTSVAPLSLVWILKGALLYDRLYSSSLSVLRNLHLGAYLLHDL
jgi:hypothetical protein